MLVPELLRQNYVLIELDMFSGRSVELKNELFKKLESDLNKFGIKKEYLMIIYRETPIENWYIQGNCGVEIRKILNKNN